MDGVFVVANKGTSWSKSVARELISKVTSRAVVPTSGFRVGTCGMGSSGRFFCGVNVEFPGCPLSQSIHGEQFLSCLMVHEGEHELKHLAVNYAPCGHCRQFLQEYRNSKNIVIDITLRDVQSPLAPLLPQSFGPADLDVDACLFERRAHGFSLSPALAQDALAAQTLKTLNSFSYAPYTLSHAAVGFKLRDGTIVAGAYLESAAYNPSLPPAQAAFVNLIARGRSFDEIEKVLLLEVEGAKISHKTQTEMVLRSVNEKAAYSTHYVEGGTKKVASKL